MYTKYKVLTGSIVLLMCFGTVGCGKQYSLKEEHNDLLAEYAANVILQNNPGYEDKLVELTEEGVTTQEVETSTTEIASESTTQNIEIASFDTQEQATT